VVHDVRTQAGGGAEQAAVDHKDANLAGLDAGLLKQVSVRYKELTTVLTVLHKKRG
jgi:hypothetical protein